MNGQLRRPISVLGALLLGGSAAVLAGPASLTAEPADPAAACRNLATLTNFPIAPTQITLAKFNPAGTTKAGEVTLPDHCQVQGIINKRIGQDGLPYGDGFEVRLPVPSQWNGRFMLQGGGGTEGAVPPAIGVAGTATLAAGWVVASQDGGHENKDMPVPNAFLLEPQAIADHAYGSIDATTRTAKFLIDVYYGHTADHSYFVGCSTGGRQGMVLSQNFPDYYDGIVAGAPVFDLEAIALTEAWGVEAIASLAPAETRNREPILAGAFPAADQKLFTSALLAACDRLDGAADGIIDDLPACWAKFDPATFVFPDSGQPLQCTDAKNATCLTPAQITAVKRINRGPRSLIGQALRAPAGALARDHADNTILGYPYDGGFMAPSGIPSRKIGTPTSPPGDLVQGLAQIPYLWLSPADPKRNPLDFDFNKDIDHLNTGTPLVTTSTSLDISAFKGRGGKIIWYHGVSDPGPPALGTIGYYNELTARNGGLEATQKFARLFLVPNMGHCRGGPATDQFDMLTPLVAWVEHGSAPEQIIATGTNFTALPTTRSRPLCPYPQQVRYTGAPGGDLSVAGNYACVTPK